MKVTLKNGRRAIVGFKYSLEQRKKKKGPHRITEVAITIEEGDEKQGTLKELGTLAGKSECSPEDKYVAFNGRSRAISRAFQQDKARQVLRYPALLDKEDRETLVKAVLGVSPLRHARRGIRSLLKRFGMETIVKELMNTAYAKVSAELDIQKPSFNDFSDLLSKVFLFDSLKAVESKRKKEKEGNKRKGASSKNISRDPVAAE